MVRLTAARSLAAACAVLLCAAAASAQDDWERPPAIETEARSQARERGEDHHPLALELDFVLGIGSMYGSEFVPGQEPVFDQEDPISVNCQSFVFGAGYEVATRFSLEARVPISFGTVPQLGQRTFAFGNIAIEGELEIELSEIVTLGLGLGITLPTAQGGEGSDFEAYDQLELNRIAAYSRGWEDVALFVPDQVGIIPILVLTAHDGQLLVEAYFKLENLIATHASEYTWDYLGLLGLGTFLGSQLGQHFDLGVRLWADVGYSEQVGLIVIAAEPQLRAHYAPLDLVLGVVIPFAGAGSDPQFVGVRLGIGARL